MRWLRGKIPPACGGDCSSNREIGKAVGMLMLLHEMTEDEAFDLLRRHPRR